MSSYFSWPASQWHCVTNQQPSESVLSRIWFSKVAPSILCPAPAWDNCVPSRDPATKMSLITQLRRKYYKSSITLETGCSQLPNAGCKWHMTQSRSRIHHLVIMVSILHSPRSHTKDDSWNSRSSFAIVMNKQKHEKLKVWKKILGWVEKCLRKLNNGDRTLLLLLQDNPTLLLIPSAVSSDPQVSPFQHKTNFLKQFPLYLSESKI